MLIVPQPNPMLGWTAICQFHQSAFDTSDSSSYSFSSLPIGDAATDRIVVVGFGYRAGSSRSITSLTIGGVAASLAVVSEANSEQAVALYYRNVPTGTTVTVEANLSGAGVRAGCGIWTLRGSPAISPVNTGSSTSGDPSDVTINAPAHSAVIAYGNLFAGGGTTAGIAISGVTQRFNEEIESSSTRHAGADLSLVAANPSLTVSYNWSGTISARALVAAAFR